MKIVRADIFGFGKWIDKTFHFSDESLICFYGKNESGKTTLQQFIIFMLFGFPPRKRASYKPKMSSRFGGRLIISHPKQGNMSIERIDEDVICYLSDGTERDEDWLIKQLNGMSEEMYRSIYSFSALDLSDIQEMKDESLGEILFSIGLTGATNIYTVERKIDRKIGDLFKPTGRIPVINKQLSKLNELSKKSAQYEQQERFYREKKERQLFIMNQLNDSERDLEQFKKELLTYEKIRHTLPTIQAYHRYNDQLNLFSHKESFPENGIDRLNELKKELIPLQSELELLRGSELEFEEVYNNILNELQAEEQYETALKLIKEKQSYVDKKQSNKRLKERLNDLEEQIEEQLDHLNIGLSDREIINLSFPFQIETTWLELSKENELLQLEKDQLLEEEHILLRKKEKLNREKSTLTEQILPDKQMESLKAKLSQDEQIRIQLHDEGNRQKVWNKTKATRLNKARNILYSSLVIAVLSVIIGTVLQVSFIYIVTIISTIIGIGQQYMTTHSIKEMEQFMTHRTPTSLKVNRLSENERIQMKHLIEEQKEYKNDLISIEKTKKDLHIEELKWEERNHLFQQKQHKHEQLINEQRNQYSFLEKVPVIHWLDLLETLKRLKEKLISKNKQEERLMQLTDDIAKFNEEIKHFFDQTNILVNEQTIEEIEDWLQTERDLLRQKEQYSNFLNENKSKQNQIKKELFFYKSEIKKLFQLAEVESEEQFFEVNNALKKRRELLEKKQTCLQQISLTFSKEDKDKVINQTLNENEIEISIQTLIEKIARIEQKINEDRDHLAEVEASLNQMETSDDFSKVIHHIEIEQQKLVEHAFEWTVLQTAKTALDEAKRAYRNKYLTEVIEKTSSYFSLITGGTYERVFPPTTTEPFLVQSPDYIRYDVKELSQGTVDQLYVSLRLAISEVMSERYNVPFIIDDAFVHFDLKRTRNIVEILLEIGKKQQVILFTCKDDIRQLIPNTMVKQIEESISVS